MCGGGAGTTTSNTTQNQTSKYTPAGKSIMQGVVNRAQDVSQLGYTPVTQGVAGLTPEQQQAMANTNLAYSQVSPYYAQAANLFDTAAQPLSAEQINQYYNPYSSAVMANMQEMFGQQNRDITGKLQGQIGGVGGDRTAVGQAELARQQGLAAGQTFASIYQNALQAAQNQQGIEQASAMGLGNLGGAQLQAALGAAGQQFGFGTAEQQTQQQGLNALYNQMLAQQAFPYQQAQWYSGLALPAAGAMGGTSKGKASGAQTSTPPSPSVGAQILGAGTAVAGGLNQAGAFGDTGWLSGGPGSYFNNGWGATVDRANRGGGIKGYAVGGASQYDPMSVSAGDFPSILSGSKFGNPIPTMGQIVMPDVKPPELNFDVSGSGSQPPVSGAGGKGSNIMDTAMKILPIAMAAINRGGAIKGYATGGSPEAQPSGWSDMFNSPYSLLGMLGGASPSQSHPTGEPGTPATSGNGGKGAGLGGFASMPARGLASMATGINPIFTALTGYKGNTAGPMGMFSPLAALMGKEEGGGVDGYAFGGSPQPNQMGEHGQPLQAPFMQNHMPPQAQAAPPPFMQGQMPPAPPPNWSFAGPSAGQYNGFPEPGFQSNYRSPNAAQQQMMQQQQFPPMPEQGLPPQAMQGQMMPQGFTDGQQQDFQGQRHRGQHGGGGRKGSMMTGGAIKGYADGGAQWFDDRQPNSGGGGSPFAATMQNGVQAINGLANGGTPDLPHPSFRSQAGIVPDASDPSGARFDPSILPIVPYAFQPPSGFRGSVRMDMGEPGVRTGFGVRGPQHPRRHQYMELDYPGEMARGGGVENSEPYKILTHLAKGGGLKGYETGGSPWSDVYDAWTHGTGDNYNPSAPIGDLPKGIEQPQSSPFFKVQGNDPLPQGTAAVVPTVSDAAPNTAVQPKPDVVEEQPTREEPLLIRPKATGPIGERGSPARHDQSATTDLPGYQQPMLFGHPINPTNLGLMDMGFRLLGSKEHNFGTALGQSASGGLDTMRAFQQQSLKDMLEKGKLEVEQQKLHQPVAVSYMSTLRDPDTGEPVGPQDDSGIKSMMPGAEAIEMMAKRLVAGDSSALTSIGWGNAGNMTRAAVQDRAAELLREQNIPPEEISLRIQEMKGLAAGEQTVGRRSGYIEMAANEAAKVIPLARAASEAVDRSQYPSFNKVYEAYLAHTGDENIVQLIDSTNAVTYAYARALNPIGSLHQADQQNAAKILENAWSKGQYSAALDQMEKEIAAAREAPPAVLKEMRQRFLKRAGVKDDYIYKDEEEPTIPSASPSAASPEEVPPAKYPDAKKAPNGKWYVQRGSQYFEVNP